MMTTADEKSPLLSSVTEDVPGLEEAGGPSKPVKLQRTVGVFSAGAIVFGNCVGAGIFISPRGVYEKTGSAGAGLIVWALAGLIATLCTLAYAELGTMMQESGGEFVYIKNTYGKFPAFLFSFCNAFLIKAASLTVITLTFSEYFAALIWGEGVTSFMVKSITASVLVLLAVLNILSCTLIVKICSVSSALKLIVVGLLVVCGIIVVIRGEGHIENFRPSTAFAASSFNPTDYGLAFYFCLFSFQGWNSLNNMTEELKSPTTTLPRGGFLGLMTVALSYVLANISYLMLFSVEGIIDSKTIAKESGYLALGKAGEMIMSIGLLVSCFGCVGGTIFCVARNIQSTAEEGLFPKWMAGVSPTFKTPIPAILTLVGMNLAYLFVDTAKLIPCLSTIEWLFYCITFSCLLYLRYTEPKNLRPFKVPLVVAIFLFLITATFVVLPLFNSTSRFSVLLGLLFLPLGALLYTARHYYLKYCSPTRDYQVISDDSIASNSTASSQSSRSTSDSGFQDNSYEKQQIQVALLNINNDR